MSRPILTADVLLTALAKNPSLADDVARGIDMLPTLIDEVARLRKLVEDLNQFIDDGEVTNATQKAEIERLEAALFRQSSSVNRALTILVGDDSRGAA